MSPLGRILVVDDEAPVREVLSEYFTTQGYTVDAAASGNDALAAVRRARPDLVLLDIRMPGIDGVEILRRIRELDEDLAVIMVTANEDVVLARETLKLGAFDYVAKPFDFSYLDRAVAAALVPSGVAVAWDTPGEASGGPWAQLANAVFLAARSMAPIARASTGERMESAALAAAREAAAGRLEIAAQHLGELELLLTIAADLSDLPRPDRAQVEAALESARRALSATR
jgi:two-component system response regulator (stage 0 sporulation protein F)